jgi:hypothetical protein
LLQPQVVERSAAKKENTVEAMPTSRRIVPWMKGMKSEQE